MTFRFSDNPTLGALLAPVTEDQFRALYWDQHPLIVRRGDSDFYGDLFTLQDFDRAIASAPTAVKTAEGKSKKLARYEVGSAPLSLERILADMRDGATLILDGLHQREPKLGLLCRHLEQELGHRFQTNLYLTPPEGQGFAPHWDNHDVFVLQVLGFKHWKIENPRRTLPGSHDQMGEDGREFANDVRPFTLNQGDLVYIPRGFVHAAECGSASSLHITLGLLPYTWADLLDATIRAAIHDNEHLRHALPLGFLHGGREDLVKGTLAALRKTADETYLSAIVDRFRDELVTKFPLDISGQVAAFFQAPQLKGEDRVGPRPGIVYRMHVGDESVRVNFGGRTITFPGFFKEPLDFALNTASYAIREITGDLEDSERIVFIERLMQEGLVVRK
jgi:ribosomal protein L16 Arg81 hydroxylase